MLTLAIDPSGNNSIVEGHGVTGWALVDADSNIINFGEVKASDYKTPILYWLAVADLIIPRDLWFRKGMVRELELDVVLSDVVIEDFILYQDKAKAQTNSRMQTSRMLGILELACLAKDIPCHFQRAVDVKARWSDDILVHKNIITRRGRVFTIDGIILSNHVRDAIRHGLHYTMKRKLKYEKQTKEN